MSFILSKLLIEPKLVWIALTFIGLILICYPYFMISPRLGFISLALYTSTITFYVFPGSGFRQALAFAFLSSAVYSVVYNRQFLCVIFASAAALTHASSSPIAAIFLIIGLQKRESNFKLITYASIIVIFSVFYFLQSGQINEKLESYTLYSRQDSALIQAVVESSAILFIFFYYRHLFNPKIFNIYIYYFISLIIIAVLFEGAGFERYYRYLYIFSIYSLSILSSQSKKFNFYILFGSGSWLIFIVSSRYNGLFSEAGLFNHLFVKPLLASWWRQSCF